MKSKLIAAVKLLLGFTSFTASTMAGVLQIDNFKNQTLLLNQSPYFNNRAKSSYLGGLPKLPKGTDWPRSVANQPMILMATINLAEVQSEFAGLLKQLQSKTPKSGYLLFFIDNESEELWERGKGYSKVMYLKELADEYTQPPADAKGVFNDTGVYDSKLELYDIRYRLKNGRYPTYFPRVPFGYELIDSKASDMDSNRYHLSSQVTFPDGKRLRTTENWHERELELSYVNLGVATRSYRYEPSTIVKVDESHPLNWLAVDISCQMMAKDIIEYHKGVARLGYYKEFSQAELEKLVKHEQDVYRWLELSKQHDFTALLTGRERQQFWGFLKQVYVEPTDELIPSKYQKILETALTLSWAYLTEKDRKERTKSDVYNYFEGKRIPLNSGVDMTHQMFGHASAIQDLGDIHEQHILLLQLSTDNAMNMMVGDVGAMQFWIKPEDLRKNDFSNVVYDIAGH